MAQTAVEWLEKELDKSIPFINNNLADTFNAIIEQAKQMEREQIVKAHDDGDFWSGKNYYKENYGSGLQNETN